MCVCATPFLTLGCVLRHGIFLFCASPFSCRLPLRRIMRTKMRAYYQKLCKKPTMSAMKMMMMVASAADNVNADGNEAPP